MDGGINSSLNFRRVSGILPTLLKNPGYPAEGSSIRGEKVYIFLFARRSAFTGGNRARYADSSEVQVSLVRIQRAKRARGGSPLFAGGGDVASP